MDRYGGIIHMVVALTERVLPQEAQLRTPWLWDRSAISVDAFRVVAGCGLFTHFVEHAKESASLRAELLGGAALSAAVALGVTPRLCAAALYLLSLALHRMLAPQLVLDDYVANIAALMLASLPIGNSLCAFAGKPSRRSRPVRVPGVAVLGLMASVLLLYSTAGLAAFAAPSSGVRHAFRALAWVAMAYLVPLRHVAIVGCLAQVCIHLYLASATSSTFTNLFLAATCVFFWGERRDDCPGKVTIDSGAALQILGIVTVGIFVLASVFGAAPANVRARELLSDAGLLPALPSRPNAGNPGGALRLRNPASERGRSQ